MRPTPLRAALFGATAALSAAAFSCDAGTFYHDRGSVDCTVHSKTPCDDTAPTKKECCCPCAAGFFCPGSSAYDAEIPCTPGTTSPPGSASIASCVGPTPAISQVHVAYTGVPGQLSVDFVSANPGPAAAFTSTDNATWVAAPAATFRVPTIGYMSHALLAWPGGELAPGQRVFYKVGDAHANSSVFAVTPVVGREGGEVFAVYGDFGAANDVCLDSLIADAAEGLFDTVLHVGDWAYNFETSNSSVGNVFMQAIQPYAATHPVMPAEGNHEACPACPGVDGTAILAGNFSEYQARMYSVGAVGAGATSGSGTPRFYSFNQGLVHFLVFSAEAYAYHSGPQFLAAQLKFMAADLKAVDRTRTPWVVGLVHKAWWMQADAYADFTPIINDGGVDVVFAGHVHYYNRLYPYDAATGAIDRGCVSADNATYTDPSYVVNIISGAPGDREDTSRYEPGADAWSVTGTSDYGYGTFSAPNATHLLWSFKAVRAARGDKLSYSDDLTIVQRSHGLRNGGKALEAHL